MPAAMINPRVAEALKEFVNALRAKLGDRLVKVVLFGSYAKGLADEFSDVDVLVVHRGDEAEVRAAVAYVTLEVGLKYNVPLEPIVMNVHEFQEETLFTREVKKFGIVLYSANPGDEALELAAEYVPLIEEYLSSARECLGKGKYRLAVDLEYNAAELAIRVLIMLKGEPLAKTHGGLLTQFGRLYIESGEVAKEVGRALHEALMLRNKARYDPRAQLKRENAEEVIELAETLLRYFKAKIESYWSKPRV